MEETFEEYLERWRNYMRLNHVINMQNLESPRVIPNTTMPLTDEMRTWMSLELDDNSKLINDKQKLITAIVSQLRDDLTLDYLKDNNVHGYNDAIQSIVNLVIRNAVLKDNLDSGIYNAKRNSNCIWNASYDYHPIYTCSALASDPAKYGFKLIDGVKGKDAQLGDIVLYPGNEHSVTALGDGTYHWSSGGNSPEDLVLGGHDPYADRGSVYSFVGTPSDIGEVYNKYLRHEPIPELNFNKVTRSRKASNVDPQIDNYINDAIDRGFFILENLPSGPISSPVKGLDVQPVSFATPFLAKDGIKLDLIKSTMEIYIGNKTYKVTVARTLEEKETGLSKTDELPKDLGMLFVYDRPLSGMWYTMEDTSLNLDIIFIDKDGKVLSVNSCKAYSDEPIVDSSNKAQFVLEVNWHSGIKVGDILNLEDVDEDSEDETFTEEDKQTASKSRMLVLDENGDVQMKLEGGERIFSRISTRKFIKAAIKAYRSDKDSDYAKVGRLVFKELNALDNRDPQYVDKKQSGGELRGAGTYVEAEDAPELDFKIYNQYDVTGQQPYYLNVDDDDKEKNTDKPTDAATTTVKVDPYADILTSIKGFPSVVAASPNPTVSVQTTDNNTTWEVDQTKLQTLLSDTDHFQHPEKGTLSVGSKPQELCTYGPWSWYKKIGVNLRFWSDSGPWSNDTNYAWFAKNDPDNWELVYHGNGPDANGFTGMLPGDVCVQFATYSSNGKPTSHACMWTGSEWKSDYNQGAKCWAYGERQGRNGDMSVQIWRYKPLYKTTSVLMHANGGSIGLDTEDEVSITDPYEEILALIRQTPVSTAVETGFVEPVSEEEPNLETLKADTIKEVPTFTTWREFRDTIVSYLMDNYGMSKEAAMWRAAQLGSETGHGSGGAAPYFNYGNITKGKWLGKTARVGKNKRDFRVYDSFEEGIQDYLDVLKNGYGVTDDMVGDELMKKIGTSWGTDLDLMRKVYIMYTR